MLGSKVHHLLKGQLSQSFCNDVCGKKTNFDVSTIINSILLCPKFVQSNQKDPTWKLSKFLSRMNRESKKIDRWYFKVDFCQLVYFWSIFSLFFCLFFAYFWSNLGKIINANNQLTLLILSLDMKSIFVGTLSKSPLQFSGTKNGILSPTVLFFCGEKCIFPDAGTATKSRVY